MYCVDWNLESIFLHMLVIWSKPISYLLLLTLGLQKPRAIGRHKLAIASREIDKDMARLNFDAAQNARMLRATAYRSLKRVALGKWCLVPDAVVKLIMNQIWELCGMTGRRTLDAHMLRRVPMLVAFTGLMVALSRVSNVS